MKLKILLFLSLSQVFTSAQIDTTVYFPLEIGNYWEYTDIFSGKISRSSVIGDTLMTNGKHYFIVDYFGSKEFFRLQDNKYFYRYYSENCTDNEYLMYDFSAQDSAIWPVCIGFSFEGETHLGLSETTTEYFSIFNQILETKVYEPVAVNGSDTCWNDGCAIFFREYVSKGVGLTRIHVEIGGDNRLVGAIINSVIFGIITSIEDVDKLPKDFTLFQNYPNPFNPSTEIKYTLKRDGFVTLKVYDVLGREVATLVNENKPAGFYTINFNASKLSSGIYFYTIKSNKFFDRKKMILIK